MIRCLRCGGPRAPFGYPGRCTCHDPTTGIDLSGATPVLTQTGPRPAMRSEEFDALKRYIDEKNEQLYINIADARALLLTRYEKLAARIARIECRLEIDNLELTDDGT